VKTISQTVLGAILATIIALPSAGAGTQQAETTPPVKNLDKAKMGADRNSDTVKRPSKQDIAHAKSEGLVWVNQRSRAYHRDGEFYGKTKQGRFMSENDAKTAGFHEAKEPKTSGKTNPTLSGYENSQRAELWVSTTRQRVR
jgi:hypothetical protein